MRLCDFHPYGWDERPTANSKWPSGDFVLMDSDLYVKASICFCPTANCERNAALILTFHCRKTIQVSLLGRCPDVLLTES